MTTEFKLCIWMVVYSSLHMEGSVQLWDAQERNTSSRIAAPFCSCHSLRVAQKWARGRLELFRLSFPAVGQFWFLPTGWGGTAAPVSLLSHTSVAFTYTLMQWINTRMWPASYSRAVKREGIYCLSFFFRALPICSQGKTSFFTL